MKAKTPKCHCGKNKWVMQQVLKRGGKLKRIFVCIECQDYMTENKMISLLK